MLDELLGRGNGLGARFGRSWRSLHDGTSYAARMTAWVAFGGDDQPPLPFKFDNSPEDDAKIAEFHARRAREQDEEANRKAAQHAAAVEKNLKRRGLLGWLGPQDGPITGSDD